jgi:hypothetical protein
VTGVRRLVVVAASSRRDPLAFAMVEDVVDLVAAMQQVEAALAGPDDMRDDLAELLWPDMPLLPAGSVLEMLDVAHAQGADEATVVCPDAPDLPALLLGKLHSALTSAAVAVAPADGGGLVALAAKLPAAQWLVEATPDLDDVEALPRLRQAAPQRALHVGAGWHRIRTPEDLSRLDPGLEGWDATRALIGSD